MFLIKIKKTFLTLLLTILGVTIGVNSSHGITRDLVIANADAYASHSWYCSWENTQYCNTNNCPVSGSAFGVGYQTGVAYKWGGFDTIANFDSKLSQDYTAGDVTGTTCTADCATGVDCSGFVSRCWGLTTKESTNTLPNISTVIPQSSLQEGDILNYPGSHVVLFDYLTDSGIPVIYEAVYGSPHKVYYHTSSWSYLNGYTPRKYNNIEETGYDLRLYSSVVVNPNPIIQNTPVTVTVSIANYGNDSFSGNIAAAIHNTSGVFLEDIEVKYGESITGGYYKNYTFNKSNPFTSPGTYKLHIKYQPDGGNWDNIPEGNYTNPVNVTIISSDSSSSTTTIGYSSSSTTTVGNSSSSTTTTGYSSSSSSSSTTTIGYSSSSTTTIGYSSSSTTTTAPVSSTTTYQSSSTTTGGSTTTINYSSSSTTTVQPVSSTTTYQSTSTIPGTTALSFSGSRVDDDSSGNSSGNNNGIIDPGETIELYVTLKNTGSADATGVTAELSTSDPYVGAFLFNTSSSYPDIPDGGTGENTGDFDFPVDPGCSLGHVITFDLAITSNEGSWTDSFKIVVGRSPAIMPWLQLLLLGD